MEDNCYKVINYDEVKSILDDNSRTFTGFDLCLSTNLCFVYYLKLGEALLIPPNYSDQNLKGLLFANKKCLFDCIDADHFSIQNERMTVAEKYGDILENLQASIKPIVKELLSEYMPEKKNAAIESATISQLLIIIQKNKLPEKNMFYAALALGEYVREVNGGKWIILKKYGTYNPYYVPAIIYPDNAIFTLWDDLSSFFQDFNTTPEIYACLPWVKSPGLVMGNAFFRNNFYGYRIF
jgi:hypothetical protein